MPQKDAATFLPTRVKNPAVARAAFCDVCPTAMPTSAAVVQGFEVFGTVEDFEDATNVGMG